MNSSPSIKKFSVENLGCAKNQVDAEQMISVLQTRGWEYAKEHSEADLIILNTCGFIEPAKKEAVDVFFSLRKTYPDKRIIVAGCFAQRYGNDLERILPEADGIFGNQNLSMIDRAAERALSGHRETLIPVPEDKPDPVRVDLLSRPRSAYVKIAEGCDNCCSYCAIPLIRGSLHSRPEGEILEEIKDLLAKGIFEINLIAQDLSHYGKDRGDTNLLKLLSAISRLQGDFWIRLLYLYPDRFPLGVLDIIADDRRILPYFDLPFQHASPKILRRMGRKGSPEIYLDLVQTIRKRLPDAVIRSTFLVGFPGEKARDVAILQDFQKKAEIDWLGVFPYSREEDTPAYKMRGALGTRLMQPAIARRVKAVQQTQIPLSIERMQKWKGKTIPVLIEEIIPEEGLYLARGPMHAPEVDGSIVLHGEGLEPGQVLMAEIIQVNGIDLEAVPCTRGDV